MGLAARVAYRYREAKEFPSDKALNEYLAVRYFQKFKSRVVARLPYEGWELTGEEIERWLLAQAPNQVSA